MIKKHQKFFSFANYFLNSLFFCFLLLSANKVFADGLEASYPKIGGQTLTATSKIPDLAIYLFKLGMSIGFFAVFFSLLVAGIMYFLSPAKPDLLANAKDRISGAITGLLIIVFSYLIISTINPQLAVFTFNSLPPAETTKVPIKPIPGVYFINGTCPNPNTQTVTSGLSDLGPLKNKLTSVDIKQDADNDNYYISILYENTNFWGKCLYVNGNTPCQSVEPFASSASVHTYDPNPDGDGVYFYHKSCFNDQAYANVKSIVTHCNKTSDGYIEITNSQIGGGSSLYVGDLNQLNFTGVPDDQKPCAKYDDLGNCTSRSELSLGGGNISSVIINGNYLVLFVFKASGDNTYGPWSSCQEFPTSDDTNKIGPRQIKWQNIRNGQVDKNFVVPNYVIIIPTK